MDARDRTFCPSCAAPLPAAARFCPSCGAPSRPAPPASGAGAATGTAATESAGPRSGTGDSSAGAFAPGAVFAGRYRIVSLLGQGGMGAVYRADDLKLGQAVALKFLPAEVTHDPVRLAAFHSEVRNARQVSHPNVCRVHDIGEADGRQFMTMEYIDGEDLRSLLKRIGRVPAGKALEIAHELCAGLAAAHERGVIHRDLKPANVMIDGHGRCRISDFGLAVAAEEPQRPGEVAGTRLYMAPEQLAGRGATTRSDIFSLGAVLYELWTGRRPFEATTSDGLRDAYAQRLPPPAPSRFAPELPAEVETAILRCLEIDPAARPATALQVAAVLPGGDPLAAAVAAGHTPSPEMVAAAGAEGSLAPGRAWALLGSFAALLAIAVVVAPHTTLLGAARPAKSPEVLAEHARELAAAAGWQEAPGDEVYWYRPDAARITAWSRQPATEGDEAARAAMLRFTYRASPRPLTSMNPLRSVSANNPPMDVPGMITVELDASGRLLSLVAVPPTVEEEQGGPRREPDWGAFLRASDLDPARLTPVAVTAIPSAPFDRRVAWRTSGEPAVEVRGASLGGLVVQYEAGPLQKPLAGAAAGPATFFIRAAWSLMWAMALALAALFAHRNVRLGRGDTRGAVRVGVFILAVDFLSNAFTAHHSYAQPLELLQWVRTNLASSLLMAVYVVLMYLALEPFVRRHRPHMLIGWSRLLAGRLRDPLVGRDVLAGALLGVGFFLMLSAAGGVAAILTGGHVPPLSTSLQSVSGASDLLAGFLHQVVWGVLGAILATGVLVIVEIALRRRWPAFALTTTFVVLVFLVGGSSWVPLPLRFAIDLVAALCSVLVLLRWGILAFASAGATWSAVQMLPLCFVRGAWYTPLSTLTVTLLAALAVYGFVVSLGGRPLLGSTALEA